MRMTTATINILDGSLAISRTTNLGTQAERGYSATEIAASLSGIPVRNRRKSELRTDFWSVFAIFASQNATFRSQIADAERAGLPHLALLSWVTSKLSISHQPKRLVENRPNATENRPTSTQNRHKIDRMRHFYVISRHFCVALCNSRIPGYVKSPTIF